MLGHDSSPPRRSAEPPPGPWSVSSGWLMTEPAKPSRPSSPDELLASDRLPDRRAAGSSASSLTSTTCRWTSVDIPVRRQLTARALRARPRTRLVSSRNKVTADRAQDAADADRAASADLCEPVASVRGQEPIVKGGLPPGSWRLWRSWSWPSVIDIRIQHQSQGGTPAHGQDARKLRLREPMPTLSKAPWHGPAPGRPLAGQAATTSSRSSRPLAERATWRPHFAMRSSRRATGCGPPEPRISSSGLQTVSAETCRLTQDVA